MYIVIILWWWVVVCSDEMVNFGVLVKIIFMVILFVERKMVLVVGVVILEVVCGFVVWLFL